MDKKKQKEIIGRIKKEDCAKANLMWKASEIELELDGPICVLAEDPKKSVFKNSCAFEHGFVQDVLIGLTLAQAKNLVAALQPAIEEYERIDKAVEEYFKNEDKKEK